MNDTKRLVVIALVMFAAVLIGGCGGSSNPAIAPSERVVPVPGSPGGKIILTSVGAQRIGIQTARVGRAPSPPAPKPKGKPEPSVLSAVVPVAAVVYDPSGNTYVFTSPGALQFTEVPVTVDHVSGASAYLLRGPRPGSTVVTVGAEELFGVQTGVLAQT